MSARLNVLSLSWPERLWAFFGLSRELASVGVVTILSSLLLALICIATDGSGLAGIGFLSLLLILTITLYRLDWGFFTFLGIVLICDQFPPPELESYFTHKIGYFSNLKTLSYIPGVKDFDAGVVNLLELHLLFLLFIWLLILVVKKQFKGNRAPVWGAALLFFSALLWSFAYGLARGGVFLPALWEVRAMIYLGVLYFFVPQVIHSKEQVETLVWVCIAAIAFKAFQGIAHYASLGFSFQGISTLTNHEDPVFMLTLLVLLIGLLQYKGHLQQKRALLWLLVPLLLGFYVAQRRAAYAAIAPSLAVFVILLPKKDQWRFFKVAAPILVIIMMYMIVFWNSHNSLAGPAQMIKSGLTTDKSQLSTEDYYSNLYRDVEKFNLAMTIRKSPILGIGFGNKYEKAVTLLDLGVSLLDYIPHNAVMWLMAKMGMLGFFLFWFFLNAFVFRGASVFSRLKDPYLKAVCIVIIVAVVNQVVVSYFDLQLTYYRNMVYLGALMGLLSPIEKIDGQLAQAQADRQDRA